MLNHINQSGFYKALALKIWSEGNVADPWIIASAKANCYTIVTEEIPSGGLSIKTPNKSAKIPDVAKYFDVKTVNIFDMMRKLHMVIK